MKKLLIIISLFMTCIFGFANAKPLDVDVTEGAKLPNFELRDFHGKYTKSKKLKFSTRSKDFLYNEILELINSFEKEDEVRLLGVYFGDIKKSSLVQLPLNKNL